jgi:hypothetical protein
MDSLAVLPLREKTTRRKPSAAPAQASIYSYSRHFFTKPVATFWGEQVGQWYPPPHAVDTSVLQDSSAGRDTKDPPGIDLAGHPPEAARPTELIATLNRKPRIDTMNRELTPLAIVREAESLEHLAQQINASHEAGLTATRQGLARFRDAGEALLKAKARCKHGEWLPWLEKNVRFSRKTVAAYMRIAEGWAKCNGASHFRSRRKSLSWLVAIPDSQSLFAERIDDILTVYWTVKGHDTAGFKLKGIRHLVAILEDFKIEATDDNGEFSLGVLFWSGLQLTDNSAAVFYYQKLARDSRDVFLTKKELEYV